MCRYASVFLMKLNKRIRAYALVLFVGKEVSISKLVVEMMRQSKQWQQDTVCFKKKPVKNYLRERKSQEDTGNEDYVKGFEYGGRVCMLDDKLSKFLEGRTVKTKHNKKQTCMDLSISRYLLYVPETEIYPVRSVEFDTIMWPKMTQTVGVAHFAGDEHDGRDLDGNVKDASDAIVNNEKGSAGQNNADIEIDNLINRGVDEIIIREKGNKDEMARYAELKLAVIHCKRCLRKIGDNERSIERVQLMEKLVQCQLELDTIKEELSDPVKKVRLLRIVTIMGHQFSLQSAAGRNPYCEVCLCTIWRLIQRYRRCDSCGLRSHDKCLQHVLRYCAGTKANDILFRPRTEICEERGLDLQNYKCAECHHSLQFDGTSVSEPRLCDYNGYYYCPRCHWNDEWFIPARIIHNWDFCKYKVCRAAKQLLVIIERRPIFNILKLNPGLVNYVDQLAKINKLRRNILLMKCYFMCCKVARKQRILQNLRHRQHFVENSEMYSLTDLVDLYQGRLLPDIENIIRIYTEHITKDCLICKGKGFVCELCNDVSIIFPFSEDVAMCRNCLATFHQECFNKRSKHCPRCLRRKSRPRPVFSVDDV
ncbi:Differentially expressed in FDCP [Dirofilaria immitis]